MTCPNCPCKGTDLACPAIPGPYRQAGGAGPHPHPRYCELHAADPQRWGPKILKVAAEDRARGPARRIWGRSGRALENPMDPWAFVTYRDLTQDAQRLMQALPPDLEAVVAIARSGLLPGTIVAYGRHLPLWTVSRHGGLQHPGHGYRLEHLTPAVPRKVLLIDDTVATGREMEACLGIVRAAWPDAEVLRAVVYAHPSAIGAVDLCVSEYPGRHYLEWNWQNAGHGEGCGYDFDGILVHNGGGDRPLYVPRRSPVPLICTGRPESIRAQTQAWIDKHGVRCERLVMWPGREMAADWRDIAKFKAKVYGETDLELFAESEPEQAELIHEITGKAVLCPAAERVFPPKKKSPIVVEATPKVGPVRVGFAMPACYRGGAEVWHHQLLRRLDPERVQVQGIAVEDPRKVLPEALGEFRGLAPTDVGKDAVRALAARCEVLVTWGPMDREGLRDLGCKVVSVCHGGAGCPITERWLAEAIPHSDALVACSDFGVGAFPESDRARVKVIPNGVDPARVATTRARHEVRADWGIPEDHRVVAYVGRLAIDDKRADLPVKAWAHMPADWHLLMVGDGINGQWIRALAGDDPRIRFLPWTDRLGDLFAGIDALVSPSPHEGFGLAMAEAMLAGVPVVAVPTGLAAGPDRHLVYPLAADLSPEGIADGLLIDQDRAEARRRRVHRAQSVVRARYGIGRWANAWCDLLDQLAGRPPRVVGVEAITGEPPRTEPDEANRILDKMSIADRTALARCTYRREVQACCGPTTTCAIPGRNRGGRHFLADCVRCVSAGLPRPDVGAS